MVVSAQIPTTNSAAFTDIRPPPQSDTPGQIFKVQWSCLGSAGQLNVRDEKFEFYKVP